MRPTRAETIRVPFDSRWRAPRPDDGSRLARCDLLPCARQRDPFCVTGCIANRLRNGHSCRCSPAPVASRRTCALPARQDFPDSRSVASSFLTAYRGCPLVVGNRMESIATFNWSIANDFAIVGDARVRHRTVPLAAPRRMIAGATARPPAPPAWAAASEEPDEPVAKPGRPNEGACAFKPPRQRCPAAACVPHARTCRPMPLAPGAGPTHCLDALCLRQRITRRTAATRRRPIC